MDTPILELLRGVRGELSSAGAGSTVSLARPRARLAWIASLMPPECSEQRRLLDMAGQVAAEIGLGQVGGSRDIYRLQSAVGAVSAVVDYFSNPRSDGATRMIDGARRDLEEAAQRAREMAVTGAPRAVDRSVPRSGVPVLSQFPGTPTHRDNGRER